MGSLFTNLSDINPSKTFWSIKVRCVKLYEIPGYAGGDKPYSIECILHDKEGDRIHATVKRELIPALRPLLQEGRLYAIQYFVVTNNTMRYKTTTNKYKIVFQARSKIVAITDDGFPTYTYDFQNFTYVGNPENMDETRLIDIIGKVVMISPIQTKDLKDGPTKQMDIVLEDTERNRIPCTLWGNFPDLLNQYIAACGSEPVVVILQMFRQKMFREQVTLSNTYNVSRLIYDNNAAEVIEFKSKIEGERQGEIVSIIPHSDTTLIEREFAQGNAFVRCIDQLKFGRELGSYWVHAEIIEVISTNDWWYLSCPKCRKKLEPCAEIYYCERCDAFEQAGKIRYRVEIKVVDNSNETKFIIWDNETFALIGKGANELRDITLKSKFEVMPKEIVNLIGMRAFFKVQVRAENVHKNDGPYTVMKLTTNENLIAKYAAALIDNEERAANDYENIPRINDFNISANDEVPNEEIVYAPPNSPIKIEDEVVMREFPLLESVKKRLFDECSTSEASEDGSEKK